MTGTFFLGLGGQKCGSSWYQAYLARAQGSDFGRLGEYQIWESDLGGPFARYRVPEPSALQKAKARLKAKAGLAIPRDYLRWDMQTHRPAYFDYFEGLLARKGVVRTGDVTPSYAALPPAMLTGIRDGFAERDIAVKVIFAMRDPVARLRSQLKMDLDKGYLNSSGDEAADLAAFHAGAEAAARTRYDMTLDAVEQVFEAENRHICLFEEMTTPDGIADLSRFADIPADPKAGGQQVNARGSGGNPLPEDLTRAIAQHYAPVYHAVAARLPQIAQVWPSARYVLS
ncbi:sulfotransferase family protein [Tropicibacter alexandrii]|uniref:sulfotransferase family protein n=1 Tax=Tropicibacter alexandrii TaxID=2267683 RepID=UPI000EF4D025|nr:sulfotransferase family protein [Tropicibacter alexandrii]